MLANAFRTSAMASEMAPEMAPEPGSTALGSSSASMLFGSGATESHRSSGRTPSRPEAELDRLLGLSLDDFAQAGMVVAVYSALFGETVLLVSDNATTPPSKDTVVYRVSELRRILADGVEELHRLHALKRTLMLAGTPSTIEGMTTREPRRIEANA